jgi:hypothetical protein
MHIHVFCKVQVQFEASGLFSMLSYKKGEVSVEITVSAKKPKKKA